MDMNGYLVDIRLAELRERALREHLVHAARAARPPLRVTLGQALIRLGHQLLGGFSTAQAPA